mmetsp:Transcript_23143/g.51415  ORF Transcript_23143/g.51415 Transcript_23143/m.51415 type:complete len:146 (+) Transcript_23143:93-530(+)
MSRREPRENRGMHRSASLPTVRDKRGMEEHKRERKDSIQSSSVRDEEQTQSSGGSDEEALEALESDRLSSFNSFNNAFNVSRAPSSSAPPVARRLSPAHEKLLKLRTRSPVPKLSETDSLTLLKCSFVHTVQYTGVGALGRPRLE